VAQLNNRKMMMMKFYVIFIWEFLNLLHCFLLFYKHEHVFSEDTDTTVCLHHAHKLAQYIQLS